MTSREFVLLRKRLDKTQKQLALLLGVSLKAVHSYEQGWRNVPDHIEKQMLFLVFSQIHQGDKSYNCWEVFDCPPERKENCPAWEYQQGNLCWFVNGTFCEGVARKSWQEKIKRCRSCRILADVLQRCE